MHREDLMQLKEILSDSVRPVKVRDSVPSLYTSSGAGLLCSHSKLFLPCTFLQASNKNESCHVRVALNIHPLWRLAMFRLC